MPMSFYIQQNKTYKVPYKNYHHTVSAWEWFDRQISVTSEEADEDTPPYGSMYFSVPKPVVATKTSKGEEFLLLFKPDTTVEITVVGWNSSSEVIVRCSRTFNKTGKSVDQFLCLIQKASLLALLDPS